MHDPKTVAFDIYLGKKQKKNGKCQWSANGFSW